MTAALRLYIALGILIVITIAVVILTACGEEPTDPVPPSQSQSPAAAAPAQPAPTATPIPSNTTPVLPTATPMPPKKTLIVSKASIDPGTYKVGTDIQPGVYAGRGGEDILNSCHWQRLSGVSGKLEDVLAVDNAIGQFYVLIKDTDAYFKTTCEVTPLADWPEPEEPTTTIKPGMHIVGRDIAPGTYKGKAGEDILNSCHWNRVSAASGELEDVIAVDNATGQFYVSVEPTDYALSTACELTLSMEDDSIGATPVPAETPASAEPVPERETLTVSKTSVDPGTYKVGTEIQPGVYAGRGGEDILNSCHWQRLSGVSGKLEDVLAVDNAIGQFYVLLKDTDAYFKTGCEVTPLADWFAPEDLPTIIKLGMHLVGRDIAPGTYKGKAGEDILNSCHWKRLSTASGELEDVIAVDNATGQFYVSVEPTDYALSTACELTLQE